LALDKVAANSVLRLQLRVGVNGSGNPVYRNKSLNNVKPTAADDDMYDVGASLAALQQYPLNGINRIDNAQLVEI